MTKQLVKLTGAQLWNAFQKIAMTVAGGDRYLDSCLSTAEAELGAFLKVERPLEGGFKAQMPPARVLADYELSVETIYALKFAFAQAIVGSREREAASHEGKRELFAIAEAIGKKFTAALRKAIGADEAIKPPAAEELDLKD